MSTTSDVDMTPDAGFDRVFDEKASGQSAYDVHYKMAMDAIGFAAQLLTPQADILAGLIKAERDMHNSLQITDPTFYIKASNSDGLRQQVTLAKAALAFVLAVQGVKNELRGAGV
jgi:hypothetical protein